MTLPIGADDRDDGGAPATPLRVCLVYDCLFPWTIGGAERWYRALAERLAAEGHEVSYLTPRQWPTDRPPTIPGVRVVPVGSPQALYRARDGRRRLWPPIRFGLGVGWHLLPRRGRYDVVHTASFPFFPLLAAAMLRRRGGYRLVVDWWEVWTRAYWREYAGTIAGSVGWGVQRLCAAVPQRAFCWSRLHAARLIEHGMEGGGAPTLLRGAYGGPITPSAPHAATPLVLFAGRHIAEKRVDALVPAIAVARRRIVELRGLLLGDGPERPAVARLVAEHGLAGVVDLPGFVDEATLADAMRRALCLVLPSVREGYGLVVVEAAARGLPSVVVAGPDNAATELIEEGVNGTVAPSAAAADLASAILRVHEAGFPLRSTTAAWFAANAERLSIDGSMATVVGVYRILDAPPHRRGVAREPSPPCR